MNDIVTVIIPSRNERFLPNTVVDLLKKAQGQIEIIVILDGYWTIPSYLEENFRNAYNIMITDPHVMLLHRGQAEGMRPGVNSAVALAKGDYLMKIDAHCMLDDGYDVKLKADCEKNWVVVPRRKRLETENEAMTEIIWAIQDVGKPDVDYEYLSYPDNPADFGGPGLNGRIWTERAIERLNNPDYDIDENLSFQGSAWFMHKAYFHELDLMDTKRYGTFWNEAQEIGLKAWLSGGQVMVNKKTWYAHLHKGKKYGRMYQLDKRTIDVAAMFTNKWMNNEAWEKQTLPFSSLIKRFWPLPGWPESWEDDIKRIHDELSKK